MPTTILAIETSCDDTAAAVVRDGRVLSNVVSTQAIHSAFGGVVPELASRAHQVYIVPVVQEALDRAGVDWTALSAVAFTQGPGLMGSLMVGVSFAKGLALSRGLPLLGVHHLHAHVLAPFADPPGPEFPYLCLLVSGGHTQILRVDDPLRMTVLGSTLDDAAGEAFDKAGKLLGLGYPAGPEIDRLAREGQPRFDWAHPRLPAYQFSFSGIKTAIRYFLEDQMRRDPAFISDHLADLCASVQYHIVEILLDTLKRAAMDTGIPRISLAGGVSANSRLRARFLETGEERGWQTFIPPMAYSTDNAAMIGVAAHFLYRAGRFSGQDVKADPRLVMPGIGD
jgi:N6-L-threonylcarbamoyladenine synthase